MGIDLFWTIPAATLSASILVSGPGAELADQTRPAPIVRYAQAIAISAPDDETSAGYSIVSDPVVGTDPSNNLPRAGSHLVTEAPPNHPEWSDGTIVDSAGEFVFVRFRRGTDAVEPVAPAGSGATGAPATTPQAQAINTIRNWTGLSWPRIAALVGVERQTLYRWRMGEPADEERLQRAIAVVDVLREAQVQHSQ